MMHRNTVSSTQLRSPISALRTALTTGLTAAAMLAATLGAQAQAADPTAAAAAAEAQAAATQTGAQPKQDITLSNQKPAKSRKKAEKVVSTKDTRQEDKKIKKTNTLATMDVKLPDKALYDKAQDAIKHGRFDVGRLDLQTLLNTYPDSQYMMRAKLAVADSWYHEGGTAALTQAEQEYKDFITFFPNAPEAAEAQMRVGDIYFKQMDKPDRDYAKTVSAEQEYRLMLQQFPDSPLVPQAAQRLREVQEVLASRERNIGIFYAERDPPVWPAAIARYQTVVDTYPLYSQIDDVLIGLGDAYEAEAKYIRTLKLPEDGKAKLEKVYDDQAIAAWSKVVVEHSAAPHAEDARDRLAGLNVPIPVPTKEQAAASEALEASRGQYTLSKKATIIFMNKSDTVQAATIGEPSLEDAKPTLAPTILKQSMTNFQTALNPNAPAAATPGTPAATPAEATTPPGTAPASDAPLTLQEVPASGAVTGTAPIISNPNTQSAPARTSGNSMGIEIVRPDAATPPVTAPAAPPAFPGTATTPAQPRDTTGGIGAVGPKDAAPLPPIEKAAPAPDVINDAQTASQATMPPPANGKKPKVECDKNDESCSKHKPKKGLGKLNPF